MTPESDADADFLKSFDEVREGGTSEDETDSDDEDDDDDDDVEDDDGDVEDDGGGRNAVDSGTAGDTRTMNGRPAGRKNIHWKPVEFEAAAGFLSPLQATTEAALNRKIESGKTVNWKHARSKKDQIIMTCVSH